MRIYYYSCSSKMSILAFLSLLMTESSGLQLETIVRSSEASRCLHIFSKSQAWSSENQIEICNSSGFGCLVTDENDFSKTTWLASAHCINVFSTTIDEAFFSSSCSLSKHCLIFLFPKTAKTAPTLRTLLNSTPTLAPTLKMTSIPALTSNTTSIPIPAIRASSALAPTLKTTLFPSPTLKTTLLTPMLTVEPMNDDFTTFTVNLYCREKQYKNIYTITSQIQGPRVLGHIGLSLRKYCLGPSAGSTFKVAYNNVAPFVKLNPQAREQGGVEPKILQEFGRKYSLKLSFHDAHFTWGSLDPATGQWNGVVGMVFYGQADIGICNIDITYERSKAIQYSGPAGANEGIIMSRKPRPANAMFNIVYTFNTNVWIFVIIGLLTYFIVLLLINIIHNKVNPTVPPADPSALLLKLLENLVGQHSGWPTVSFAYSAAFNFWCFFAGFFIFFYTSVFFSFMVSVPMEPPVDSAKDLMNTDTNIYICAGGSFEMHFRAAITAEQKNLYVRAQQLPRGVTKCTNAITGEQNDDVIQNGASRILPRTRTLAFRQEMYSKLGYDPFYIGKEILLNLYTGFPVRKNITWKNELDSVVGRLAAGGFPQKWLMDQFSPEIFLHNEDTNPDSLQLASISGALVILAAGLLISSIIFGAELMVKSKIFAKKVNCTMAVEGG